MTTNSDSSTAAVLLIGNELLSGRTQDVNLAHIGQRLSALGIPLREARVVPDIDAEIIDAVRALSARYTYVFTTGGIGPTHDDITTSAIARAFGRELFEHPQARARLLQHYRSDNLTEPRRKMAMVPAGSTLIDNTISAAPGFRIENVFVLAGVPPIMQAMFEVLAPQLQRGRPILTRSVTAPMGESRIAAGLEAIQHEFVAVDIGSYPKLRDGRPLVSIVMRGCDANMLEQVAAKVIALMRSLDVPAAEIEQD
jgi:molybdenum cofactor synthesis domain-containing protein